MLTSFERVRVSLLALGAIWTGCGADHHPPTAGEPAATTGAASTGASSSSGDPDGSNSGSSMTGSSGGCMSDDPSSGGERESSSTGGEGLTVVSLGASAVHGCAVVSDGTVWCWGDNEDGALGSGQDGGISLVPQVVVSPETFVQVVASAGQLFRRTAAIGDDGRVWAWGGRNADPVPQLVSGAPLGVQVAAVDDQLCVVSTRGEVWCSAGGWIPGVADAVLIVAGHHSCAGSSDGSVRCWGQNDDGQIGTTGIDGAVVGPPRGNAPRSLVAWSTRSNLQYHGGTCMVPADGSVWCWGDAMHADGPDAQPAPGLADVEALGSVGGSSLLEDGTVWLPSGAGDAEILDDVVHLARRCAVRRDHTVWCWGANDYGQLGDGTVEDSDTPVEVVAAWNY